MRMRVAAGMLVNIKHTLELVVPLPSVLIQDRREKLSLWRPKFNNIEVFVPAVIFQSGL